MSKRCLLRSLLEQAEKKESVVRCHIDENLLSTFDLRLDDYRLREARQTSSKWREKLLLEICLRRVVKKDVASRFSDFHLFGKLCRETLLQHFRRFLYAFYQEFVCFLFSLMVLLMIIFFHVGETWKLPILIIEICKDVNCILHWNDLNISRYYFNFHFSLEIYY